jgi:site-specific recombinase XerD
MSLEILFQQYVQHGMYLRGWSPKTVAIYRRVLSNFQMALREVAAGGADQQLSASSLTKAQLETWVCWMRQQNRSATYINIHIRSLNAFLHWAFAEEHLGKRLVLKQVPNPQKRLQGISDKEVALILAFRPRVKNELRAWVLVKFLLDTGLRIDEILGAPGQQSQHGRLPAAGAGQGQPGTHRPVLSRGAEGPVPLWPAKRKAGY